MLTLKKKNKYLEKRIKSLEEIIELQDKTFENAKEIIKDYEDLEKTWEKNLDEQMKKSEALEKENFNLKLLIPSKFPVEQICSECANSAWYGLKNSTRVFECVENPNIKLVFQGHTYESGYEFFTADCNVYVRGDEAVKTLYSIDSECTGAYKMKTVKNGTLKDVHKYIEEHHYGFREITEK